MTPRGHSLQLRRTRSGFAMPVAIVLLALVSIALSALMMTLNAEATRTRLAAQDAQLRQFVLLAGPFAEQELDRHLLEPSHPVDVPLPKQFHEMGATLRLQMLEDPRADHCVVQVDARLSHRRAGQTLHFVKHANIWRLTDAQWLD